MHASTASKEREPLLARPFALTVKRGSSPGPEPVRVFPATPEKFLPRREVSSASTASQANTRTTSRRSACSARRDLTPLKGPVAALSAPMDRQRIRIKVIAPFAKKERIPYQAALSVETACQAPFQLPGHILRTMPLGKDIR